MQQVSLFLAAALSMSAAVHADVKLVQETRTGGDLSKRLSGAGSTTPTVPTITMFYKGSKTRTESAGRVTVFDGQRTLLLNTSRKTYQVLPKDAAAKAMSNPMLAMMDIKADVQVKSTGKTQTLMGKKANQYRMTMTMQLNMKPGASGAPKSEAPKFPPITSTTELWTAEFPGVVPATEMAAQALPAGMGGMSFVKDISQKMKAVRGIPLLTTMTQNVMGKNLTVTVKTVSLSEAPLPEGLFGVPAGYKQVPYEPPTLPMGPG